MGMSLDQNHHSALRQHFTSVLAGLVVVGLNVGDRAGVGDGGMQICATDRFGAWVWFGAAAYLGVSVAP